MSQFSRAPINYLDESTLRVLEISRTELCAVHFTFRNQRQFATYRFPDGNRAKQITNYDDGVVFAGASLFKVFIATGLALIIKKLSANFNPTNKYHGLRGGWQRTFTEVFNELSDEYQIGPLAGNPTVQELMLHYKAPCNINHLIFAPDGSPLLSKNDFLNNISKYTEDTRDRNEGNTAWCEYSNASYILISFLIEVASGMTLHEFLKKNIFDRLGMHRTYTTVMELDSVPQERRTLPHVVSGDGVRRAIVFETIPYLADTVELATMGGYICAADVGIFFEAVQKGLDGESIDAEFDATFVRSLFGHLGSFDGKDHGYTPFGLFTTFDEDLPGSHSLSRLISPHSDCWTYTLGKNSDGEKIQAYYMAGSATGWACTAYFVPKYKLFITTLTNTSGPLDASEIISRLYLQDILDLRPSKIGDPDFICRPLGWENMSSTETYMAHYVQLAQKIHQENSNVSKTVEEDDKAKDTPSVSNREVLGKYINKKSSQTLEVTDLNGVLRVRLSGESKHSGLMRFVRKGNKFRICSAGFPGLAIDCFGDWKEPEFEFKIEHRVTTLLRRGANLDDVFTAT